MRRGSSGRDINASNISEGTYEYTIQARVACERDDGMASRQTVQPRRHTPCTHAPPLPSLCLPVLCRIYISHSSIGRVEWPAAHPSRGAQLDALVENSPFLGMVGMFAPLATHPYTVRKERPDTRSGHHSIHPHTVHTHLHTHICTHHTIVSQCTHTTQHHTTQHHTQHAGSSSRQLATGSSKSVCS